MDEAFGIHLRASGETSTIQQAPQREVHDKGATPGVEGKGREEDDIHILGCGLC
jgi:hypothetical protein